MYILEKTFHFEAGHELIYHDGKCREPHGHSYVLTVTLSSETLIQEGPKTNMVCDFQDLSDIVKPMIKKYLDHQWLNKTLDTHSPTAEFIASWIYRHLKPQLPQLKSITLHETHTSKVTYTAEIGEDRASLSPNILM